jgi:xylulokinase
VKAALVDPDQDVVSTAQVGVELESRQPGWAEADPREWWQAICRLVPTLLEPSDRDASEIDAVAAAGMVPAVLALDDSGQPLRSAILQNDARATRQALLHGDERAGQIGIDDVVIAPVIQPLPRAR